MATHPHKSQLPVPDKPELYQRHHKGRPGKFIVRYPTVRVVGGRCAGSFPLMTKDPKEAKQRMQEWLASGALEQQQAADLAAHEAFKKRGKSNGTNGHKAGLPALIPQASTAVARIAKHGKKADRRREHRRLAREAFAAQMHSFAIYGELMLSLAEDDD